MAALPAGNVQDDEADVVIEGEEDGDVEENEPLNPDLIRKADEAISKTFVDGVGGYFDELVELILDEGLPVDYQVCVRVIKMTLHVSGEKSRIS